MTDLYLSQSSASGGLWGGGKRPVSLEQEEGHHGLSPDPAVELSKVVSNGDMGIA